MLQEWWSDIWLQEGFAEYMQYVCINNIYPDYNIWGDFMIDELKHSKEFDALPNTHPLEVSKITNRVHDIKIVI